MNLRTTLAVLVLACFSLPALASKASSANNFILVDSQSGKPVGKAAYTIRESSKGYKVGGFFQYKMPSNKQGQYDMSYRLDSTGNFLFGSMQDQAAQKTYNFQPNKQRTSIEVSTIQAGGLSNPTSAALPKPEFYFAAIGDPSAIQVLMTSALAHPHPDSIYLLLIPMGAINPMNRYRLVSVQPDAARSGTLDGKSVALKSFTLRFHTGPAGEVYLDDSNNLMEADIPKLQLNYVRKNFTLSPAPSAQ